ncbi:peptidoglycan DD-metalloendopeptidase family protein [Paludifilum halophilum]|nr:peptidoglycan DD-metalloendopeptidase family protein [Paludifilum halophilum]
MGKPVTLIVAGLLTMLLIFYLQDPTWYRSWEVGASFFSEEKKEEQEERPPSGVEVPFQKEKGKVYFRLSDLEEKLGMDTKYDEKEGTISLHQGSTTLHLLRGTTVLSRNRVYLPVESPPIIRKGDVWIPLAALKEGLGRSVRIHRGTAYVAEADLPAAAVRSAPKEYRSLDAEGMREYLSFLQSPVQGATVSTQDSHLPGAPREYRNGVHEGLDYYSWTSGISIDSKTPVTAAAEGVVVRADNDYEEMSEKERNRLLEKTADNNGQTPEYILDKMRGRSVWIQHEKGVLTRYVHLSAVSDDIEVGTRVRQGDVLGYIGNSGTRSGVKHNEMGLHLHFDLLIYKDWFWKRYTPQERRGILEQVLND